MDKCGEWEKGDEDSKVLGWNNSKWRVSLP